ncbi:MAG: ExeM/NucH family extracellular endonuclease, partial [Anaerolineaceae bacterium]|nr:ExeM/NucH family extracellular endonuclease [Anaerolineaceae bacterium]
TGAASVSVLINEVDADQTSTDTAEFLELYDGGAGNTALDGLVVVFFNGSSDTSYAAFDLDTYSTRANGYFVICGNAATVANCDLDVSPDTDLIQNGADAVALYTANAADFPNGTAVTTTNLVDAIVYDTNDADDAGLLVLLNAGQPQVNEGTNNSTVESNQRCPNGSGGARNTSSYAQFNPTPGAENICMNIATQMIINEVDADTPGTDVAEFVELYDGGAGNTALDGLVVVFYNGSNDLSYAAYDLDTYSTSATGYFVLGNAGVPGAGITFASNGLQNGADAVAIYIGDAADFPNGTAVTTTNLLDAIVYDTADSDDAELLVLLNAGQPQVDEDSNSNKDLESSQRCPNGTGGQRNTSSYAQFLPTAGTANVCNNNAIDLELTKTVDDNNPDGGDTITYTLTVSNVSTTQGATNVFVRDYLPNMPAEITSVSFGPCSQGSTAMLPAVEWAVGDLAAGASATCPIQVTVALGTDGTSFENIAEVWSVTETNDPDSTPGNLGAAPAEDDEASVVVQVGVPAACGTTADMIHAIQGTGSASADVGLVRTIEGVVVGDFQTSAGLSGFFVQEEDGDVDANPATSEGIFVNDGGAPAVDVSVGDLVRVTGTVTEFFNLTEITTVTSVLNCGTGTATAAAVTMPVASLDVWEQHEGMLVTIPQTLYTTGHYTLGRYGEVSLSVGGRLSNPTNVAAPGAAAIALKDLNNRSRIQLEDGRTVSNPDPVPYLAADNTLREGDTLPSLTGVLNYAFGAYEIHPVGPLSFTRANPRPAAPPTVGGTVKVASMNVLNYFTTIDAGSPVCGPTGGMDCRGADSAAEFLRQRTKIILAITAMDADVIGLMEMENHPSDAALTDLVNG